MKPIDAAWRVLKGADFREEAIRNPMREQAMLADYTTHNPDYDPSDPSRVRYMTEFGNRAEPIESDIPMNVMQILADEDLREAIYGKRVDGPEVGEVTHQLRGQRLNQFTPNKPPYSTDEFFERAGSINPRTNVRVRGGYPYQEYSTSPTMFPPIPGGE